MHKDASDLIKRDRFLMAGGHYEIIDTYETVDEEMIRIVFASLAPTDRPHRNTLIIPRNTLFVTT